MSEENTDAAHEENTDTTTSDYEKIEITAKTAIDVLRNVILSPQTKIAIADHLLRRIVGLANDTTVNHFADEIYTGNDGDCQTNCYNKLLSDLEKCDEKSPISQTCVELAEENYRACLEKCMGL